MLGKLVLEIIQGRNVYVICKKNSDWSFAGKDTKYYIIN